MSVLVLLDTGPLGLVTNPNASQESQDCNAWLASQLAKGTQVRVPEIADYELRRELLRANKRKGVARLDGLRDAIGYVPITTETMRQAAQFWADVRKRGMPTTDEKALDGDVILAAQAVMLEKIGHNIIIATTNVRPLSRFTTAREWRDIS